MNAPIEQHDKPARLYVDVRTIRSFECVAAVARQCKLRKLPAASVLPRNDMFNMKRNERGAPFGMRQYSHELLARFRPAPRRSLSMRRALFGEEAPRVGLHDRY